MTESATVMDRATDARQAVGDMAVALADRAAAAAAPEEATEGATARRAVVNSYTEWDPPEEVVVGRLAGGAFPSWQASMFATMPEGSWRLFQQRGGSPLPPDQVQAADRGGLTGWQVETAPPGRTGRAPASASTPTRRPCS